MTALATHPPPAALPEKGPRRLSRGELLVLVALTAWGLGPVVGLVIHALGTHETLTGADGIYAGDQLQYLAWIRDAGAHGLISNLFEPSPTAHVYLQPLFALSGVLWRLGLPLVATYWLWKPVAIAVLFAGVVAFAGRLLPGRSRWAAACLCLFMLTPVASLAAWVHVGSLVWRTNVLEIGAEMMPAGFLWGYAPSAIATGLMPIVLLALERAMRPDAEIRGPLALAAGGSLLIAWLHPWQGAALLLMVLLLGVWEALDAVAVERRRAVAAIGVTAAAAALPLLYYFVLSKADSAWRLAAHNELVRRPSIAALAWCLIPLLPLVAAGARRPGRDLMERGLLLWIPACIACFAAIGAFSSHALEGLGLPLGILAIRGWFRLRLPVALAALAIGLITIPGIADEIRAFHDSVRVLPRTYYLTASDSRALRWVQNAPAGGAVLAPWEIATSIPSQTGRRVWVGQEYWSLDWRQRFTVAEALFTGALTQGKARRVVAFSGARVLVSDCAHRFDLRNELRGMLSTIRAFGCARVYVVRRT